MKNLSKIKLAINIDLDINIYTYTYEHALYNYSFRRNWQPYLKCVHSLVEVYL